MDDEVNSNSDSGDNASPRKQTAMKRNSLLGDELLHFDPVELEDDDWRDVFDDPDDASAKEDASVSGGSSSSFSSSPPHSGSNQSPTDSPPSSSSTKNETSDRPILAVSKSATTTVTNNDESLAAAELQEPSGGASVVDNGIRASKIPRVATVGAGDKLKNGGLTPSPRNWHNHVEDKPHRDKMIQDILQLLLARKKQETPDEKWVARLKAQARAFESQLYKNATTLESYKDRTTLKRRIAKLADAFASYFKQAKQRKSIMQNASTRRASMPSLGTLDVHLSDSALPQSSMGQLPNSLANTDGPNLRRQQSLPAVPNPVSTMSGPLINNLGRVQSETLGQTGASFGGTSGNSNMSSSIIGANFNTMMGSNLSDIMGPMSMQQQSQNNQQLQQQFMANMQQQQRVVARQMSIGGVQNQPGNNPLMSGQAAMMGNNGMSILSQMQQQQTNPMMMNLMQQQQNMFQQQQNSLGLNMMQNPSAAMMMGNNGMNMMNMSMQNVIPGPSIGGIANMQGMNFSSDAFMGCNETMTMPPPGMLNNPGMPHRHSGTNDDPSPLSPGTFHW